MHIPSQEQWQKVIDTLKSVVKFARKRSNFNMDIGISINEPCGTVCCVAGWYVFANTDPKERVLLWNDSWLEGRRLIANDLGFNNPESFKDWAYSNPDIWGNNLGYSMFVDPDAYNCGVENGSAETLSDVIKHFEYVKKQCYAYSKKKSMAGRDR